MATETITSNSTQPMDPEGATGKLCNWVESLKIESIPTDVRTRAQYLLLDGIACALVGAHLPWSAKAANAVFEMEPAGDSEVIGWNRRISPLAAALINSTFIQGFELDDWHSEAPLHSNSIILPALFAATEHSYPSIAKKSSTSSSSATTIVAAPKAIDGKAFLLAYVVGLEVGPRVGNALYGADMITRGWHSGAVFGPAASSLATCKLLGLSAGTTEDALGIACTQACGLMSAQFESEVKRMQHGFAARNGLLGTLLAKGGYVGIKKVLEREYGGFLTVFGQWCESVPRYKVEEVTEGVGKKWQTWGVRVKPYAAMAGTHPTVDCIRKIQAEHPELMKELSDVTNIKLEMGQAAFHHGGWKAKRPLTSTGAQMSNAYVAATQLVDGQVLPAQFRHDKLESDEVWDLVDKTTCEFNQDFDGKYTQRATINFKDKPTVTATVNAAKGVDPALTNEEIVEKWRLITKGVIDDERREKIEKLCLNFEAMDDVMELLNLLAGKTRNPIE